MQLRGETQNIDQSKQNTKRGTSCKKFRSILDNVGRLAKGSFKLHW